MKAVLAILATLGLATSAAIVSLVPNNSAKVAPLTESMLSQYSFNMSDKGYKIYGNNLFINNETRTLADIDSSDYTSNSSSITIPVGISFSEALLIFATDSTNLNASYDSAGLLISKNGVEYNYKNADAFGSANSHTIAIVSLTPSDISPNSSLYVSAPILEDTENLEEIQMAAWYLILLDNSGEVIHEFNLSLERMSDTDTGLSLRDGTLARITAQNSRNPNRGFTKIGDIVAGESRHGNFGTGELGFIYLNENLTLTPRPAVLISKILTQDENNPNDTFEMEVILPPELSNTNFIVELDLQDTYVLNSTVIPAGLELSGPLTDAAGDDILTFSQGKITLNFNSGQYQLNNVNNTKVRFSAAASGNNVSIAPKIQYVIAGEMVEAEGNYIPFTNLLYWQDVSAYGFIEKKSLTRSSINLYTISTLDLGESAEIEFMLPEFVAIEKSELTRNNCSVGTDNLIKCTLDLQGGLNETRIEILTRRAIETISFNNFRVNVINNYADPNYNNNIVILKEIISDK